MTCPEPQIWIFQDRKMRAVTPAELEQLTPGRMSGPGVFETLLVQDGRPVFWQRHLRRLSAAVTALGLEGGLSEADLVRAVDETLRGNGLSQARLRIMVWSGHCAVVAQPFVVGAGQPVVWTAVLSERRIDEQDPAAAFKTVDYQPYARAGIEAVAAGYDEALLLNTQGQLAEGSRTNVFWVQQGGLYTPALATGCLNGIVRQVVLAAAARQGIPVRQVGAPPAELLAADEAFVTNSLRGLVPLRRVSPGPTCLACPGPVTQRLARDYLVAVRADLADSRSAGDF